MGMIINIDEALKLRTDYNVLREPLNKMLSDMQEAWERKNPIDLLFKRGSLTGFQETYTSSIGFDRAFKETSDYAIAPIFNTAEGFAATYRSRTFQGSFIITQQTLEDGKVGQVKDDASAFMKRWHGDIVEYCMTAIDAGFGVERNFEGSRLKLCSADTASGDITDANKNPLFYKSHTTVKRDESSVVKYQSNMFAAMDSNGNGLIEVAGEDPAKVSKMADFINYVITAMENYYDDNGKRAGVLGSKTIVAPNDPRLSAVLNAAVSMDMFGQEPNVAYKRATVETTPYLNDIEACKNGRGFFIVDKAYNAENHGLELTERIPLTLDVVDQKRPKGIVYDGRQRFDVNVATWRGIAYCYIADEEAGAFAKDKFTLVEPVSTVKPVGVVGTVTTKNA